MVKRRRLVFWIVLIAGIVSVSAAMGADETPSSSEFVSGRIVWDVPLVPMAPDDAMLQLQRIGDIHERLLKEGKEPQLVVVARYRRVQDVTTLEKDERTFNPAVIQKLHRLVRELMERPGVKVFADDTTRRALGWNADEGLVVVEEPIVALVNYQLSGYALVPMYPVATH